MPRLSFRLLTFAFSTVLAATVIAGGDGDSATLNGIASYRQWTKVNPEPLKVENPVGIIPDSLAGG